MSLNYETTQAGAAQEPGVSTRDLARAAWASSLGSALEYYDFALYSLASALVFSPLFFPGSNPATGLILSFGTYFLGFAIRPLGGIIFGRLGDRLGRKFVLLATILLMGGASTLIGVLPTYNGSPGDWYGAGAGMFAPILLIALRLMQGLGAGAEMAGASILMTEYAPARRRGFIASLPFLGVQMGTVTAALVYFLLLNTNQAVKITETWLWRVPFLASVLILGIAIYIRLRLKESPHLRETRTLRTGHRAAPQDAPEALRKDRPARNRAAHGGKRRFVHLPGARDCLRLQRSDRHQGPHRGSLAGLRRRRRRRRRAPCRLADGQVRAGPHVPRVRGLPAGRRVPRLVRAQLR
ncbi:MFS transporter [Burkholderia sp. RS01]|uniref:MFS transporter n=1 Tax=unclassified Burkholderia TaxID=2613784 RepID=UPI0032185989